ncbi:ADP-glyceromanno-heptose 6-epimerase [Marinibaculum pumilum]|uniref:ADP-L-glycero-D-manno-heptose-6-epimerase n=1 Tax=Marinibaculum pumilum TaxID=1766165 RepID=A0ABV7L8Q5_9PROT
MILVTGGAGFIGSNIVAALAAAGEEVAVCDWFGSDDKWRNLAKHDVVSFVAPEDLPDWLTRAPRLTAVVHMGAISATTERDVDLIVATNIRLSWSLWEWCAAAEVPFIYASSAATYGDGLAGFDDDNDAQAMGRLRPLNPYGWSKLAFDRRVIRAVQGREPRPPQWVGLRFFNVYGPNEYHKGRMQSVISQNYSRIAAGEEMRLFRSYRSDYADGGQLRDFIYVRDCVDVVLWLLSQTETSGIFNVGTGRARSWNDLAQALFAAAGREPRISYIPMPEDLQERYQYFTEARMDRLRAAGYPHAFTSLEDGVAAYVQGFLASDDPYR